MSTRSDLLQGVEIILTFLVGILTLFVLFQQTNIMNQQTRILDQQRQLMSPPAANLTISAYNFEKNLSFSRLTGTEGYQVPFVVVNTGMGASGPISLDTTIQIDGKVDDVLTATGNKSKWYTELQGTSSGNNTDFLMAVLQGKQKIPLGFHNLKFNFTCLACNPQKYAVNVEDVCFFEDNPKICE